MAVVAFGSVIGICSPQGNLRGVAGEPLAKLAVISLGIKAACRRRRGRAIMAAWRGELAPADNRIFFALHLCQNGGVRVVCVAS